MFRYDVLMQCNLAEPTNYLVKTFDVRAKSAKFAQEIVVAIQQLGQQEDSL